VLGALALGFTLQPCSLRDLGLEDLLASVLPGK
jgi:hypothetical protein